VFNYCNDRTGQVDYEERIKIPPQTKVKVIVMTSAIKYKQKLQSWSQHPFKLHSPSEVQIENATTGGPK